jgi:type II secretory pathway component PulC
VSQGRFGVQVQDDRWIFERRRVLEYYNSVLEDADRLVSLFDSLKPLYDESKKINGYILIPEGEKEFFKEVGLQEGDVIRKVNSMPMMNRRIAEGFIRDFGNNELNVAVLELERAGQPVKLVYELR